MNDAEPENGALSDGRTHSNETTRRTTGNSISRRGVIKRTAAALAALGFIAGPTATNAAERKPPVVQPLRKLNVPNFAHRTAAVNGVQIHYVIAGKGAPVVLLHGWPQTWYQWRYVIPALAKHYTVIAPDMRGYADSSKPYTGYDTQTMAEDIFQLALQLGHQRVSVVGHDVGAAVAYAYAAAHRENVRRLVYIDEPLPGFSYQQFAAFNPDPAGGGGFWWASFHQVPDLPELLIAGQERLYISYFYNLLSFNKGAIDEDALSEYTRAYSMPGAMRASRGFYRDISLSSQQNHESARTKLQMPVLAIGAVPAGAGQAPILDMQAVVENVRPVIIEESGHFIAEEQPDVLNEHLLAFLIEDD